MVEKEYTLWRADRSTGSLDVDARDARSLTLHILESGKQEAAQVQLVTYRRPLITFVSNSTLLDLVRRLLTVAGRS